MGNDVRGFRPWDFKECAAGDRSRVDVCPPDGRWGLPTVKIHPSGLTQRAAGQTHTISSGTCTGIEPLGTPKLQRNPQNLRWHTASIIHYRYRRPQLWSLSRANLDRDMLLASL